MFIFTKRLKKIFIKVKLSHFNAAGCQMYFKSFNTITNCNFCSVFCIVNCICLPYELFCDSKMFCLARKYVYNVLYNDKMFPLLGHKMARCVQLTSSFFMSYSENAGFFTSPLYYVMGQFGPFTICCYDTEKNCCINVYNAHSL